jgi:hypothetical protein
MHKRLELERGLIHQIHPPNPRRPLILPELARGGGPPAQRVVEGHNQFLPACPGAGREGRGTTPDLIRGGGRAESLAPNHIVPLTLSLPKGDGGGALTISHTFSTPLILSLSNDRSP